MKILEVLGEGPWGGGSVVVLSIVNALLARGDEVWVACREGENARRFRAAGARVVNPPLWFHPINPLDAVPFLYLAWLCFREKFDLIATHTSKGGFVGRMAARSAGAPHIVHHAHGFSYNKALGALAHKFFVCLERFAARAGDFIISVNDQHRAMAVELGVVEADRIATVHNGVDFTPHRRANRAAARKQLGFPETDLLIGTTGRLAPQKGFTYLVRAMPLLLASFPSARLLIVGEGPLDGELKQEARALGVADRIHFLGFRHDVPDLLAAFDVYALPSLWEGLSISLIEALAAGKPIVATSIDGNTEVLDHMKTGLMVPPTDVVALAEGIRTVLADPDLAAALARNARLSAETRFSFERMVAENVAVYDSVVSGGLPDRSRTTDTRSWKGSGMGIDPMSTGRSGAAGT